MKKLIALIMVAVMAVCTVACNAPAAEEAAPTTEVNETEDNASSEGTVKVKIGVTNCSDTDTFTKMVADTLKTMIEEGHPEWEATFVGAEMDSSIQLSQVETFLADGCNYICLSSADTAGSAPALDLCTEAGVALINYVNPIEGDETKYTYVGGYNPTCGHQIAEYAAEVLPENATICIMEGDPGAQNGALRVQGIKDGLAELRPDIKILASQTAYWSREDGMSLMEDWLETYGENGISAVLCANDQMALGAVEAIKAHGIENGKIVVTGVDGTEDAWNYIKEGSMSMSLFYNHIAQATGVYNTLEKLVASDEKATDWVYTEFERVDASNVDEYLTKYFG